MAPTKPTTSPRRFKFTKTGVAALPIPSRHARHLVGRHHGRSRRARLARRRRTYFLQSRARTGRGVKITIGVADLLSADQAREAANKHLAAIALDRDPAAERRAWREAERERRRQGELEEQASPRSTSYGSFEAEHVAKLRLARQDAYGLWYARHIAPRLGSTRLRDLTRGKVQGMVTGIAEAAGRSTANRCLAVISGMLSFGEAALDKYDARRFPDAANCAAGSRTIPSPAASVR